jgi:formylglycine-generating enzyme required for sulfatase activity
LLDLKRQRREGPQLQKGDRLSERYLLIEKLGSGGFASVWRARDKDRRQQVVALKLLHGQHTDSAERRDRFRRGARVMQQLSHPNIVRILDLYREDRGYHYFTMEYVAGGTIVEAVTSGTLTAKKRARLLLQVGGALAFAHEQGIIHRDVTPRNILIDSAGSAKLTDFDLVRVADSTGGTRGGMGTFVFAAPECLAAGGEVDQRCDIYSLGMTAVFALRGEELPLEAPWKRLRFIKELDCSRRVKVVLARATDPDRDRRFETMKEFCSALREAFAKLPAPSEKASDSGPASAVPHVHLAARVDRPPPREGEIVNSIGMRLALIPAGKFLMGSPQGEGSDDERPQHEVEITRAFYLGIHQVTQVQWRAVMGSNPSYFCATGGGKDKVIGMNTDDFPVEQVNWHDAVAFLKKLSALNEEREAGREYRLPSEAEWEYSCRGGRTEKAFHYGNSLSSTQANFDGNHPYGGADNDPYLERTCKVGSYQANAFGLFDVHGNVWEWCEDWYARDYYANSPGRDPAGASEGSSRVIRGGGWDSYGANCRSAFRVGSAPRTRRPYLGFRVALLLSE